MLKGLYTAYTGMINEQHRMDVMTNNLANATTNGFKKEGATSQAFRDVLTYKIKDLSEGRGIAKQLGMNNFGVKIGEGYTDYSEGPIRESDSQFDLAISGPGFFEISYTNKAGETSTKYTRNGNFTMDINGYLVTQDGDYVMGANNNRIRLDPLLDFRVDTSGNIMQGEETAPVAQIRIRDFEDYDYLSKFGENMYDAVDGATVRDAEGATLHQGYLEGSNISVVTEMVNMINISRAYETNQKVIQTYDGSLDIAVNQLGRL
jgi:fagellar hook-basal body proteins